MTDLQHMIQGYTECALWSSTYESPEREDNPMDDGRYQLSDAAKARFEADCEAFLKAHREECDLWASARQNVQYDGYDLLGHDLWLTRNGHGTGFWDRYNRANNLLLWDLGQKMTKWAHAMGECDLYVSDDGEIEVY